MAARVAVAFVYRGRDPDDGVPSSQPVEGFAPSQECPLAIVPAWRYMALDQGGGWERLAKGCLLYTSDAADE